MKFSGLAKFFISVKEYQLYFISGHAEAWFHKVVCDIFMKGQFNSGPIS